MTPEGGESTDVLIVGAGPTGMIAAALLDRLGLSVRLLEQYPSRLAFPKAHVINPVSLDLCRQAGFDLDEIVSAAKPPEVDRLVRFRTSLLGAEIGAIPFERQLPAWVARQRVNLAQPRFEAILERRVRTLSNVEVVRGRWTGLAQNGDGVLSTVDLLDGGTVELRSRYLLGADGANSAVRQRLGIEMTRFGEPTYVVSVHFAADLGPWLDDCPAELYFVVDPRVRGTFIAHEISREMVYSYYPKTKPDLAEATAQLRAAIGRDDVPFEIIGISDWDRVSEVAESFAQPPVFLLGDAAHKLPPTGGLGMNTGIQDSGNLAWKLAAVVHGWASEALLHTYPTERRPIALANTLQSSQNATATESFNDVVGAAVAAGTLDQLGDEEIARLTDTQWDHFNSPGLQLAYGYGEGQQVAAASVFEPSGALGRRLPHVLVDDESGGTRTAVADLVELGGLTVFVQGRREAWTALTAGSPVPLLFVDLEGRVSEAPWLELTGLSEPGAALVVRPDLHIAARVPQGTAQETAQAWEKVSGALRDYLHRGVRLS